MRQKKELCFSSKNALEYDGISFERFSAVMTTISKETRRRGGTAIFANSPLKMGHKLCSPDREWLEKRQGRAFG